MMNQKLVENQHLSKLNYTDQKPHAQKFDNCTFTDCVFTNSDLSGITFMECTFTNCDFSNSRTKDTALKNAKFVDCKLVGFKFADCSEYFMAVEFDGCNLHFASFYQTRIQKTIFKDCNLQEVDFSGADLTGASFENCELVRAIFDKTILEKADFRKAHHFVINPESNRIKKAKFSIMGVMGLLDKYDIEVEDC